MTPNRLRKHGNMGKASTRMIITGAILTFGLLVVPGAVTASASGQTASSSVFSVPDEWKDLTGNQATVPSELADVLAFEAGNQESRDVGTQISNLIATEPEFAYAYLDESWTVGFAGAVPDAVRDGLRDATVVFDEHLGYSSADLERLVESALGAVYEALPESSTVGGGLDYREKVFSINVGIVDGAQGSTITESALATINLLGYSPVVTTTATPNGGVDFQSYGQAGGTRLTAADGNFCTSGFVTKSTTSSDLGILTASHCPNVLRQDNARPFWFTTAAAREYLGANGDVQFNRSPVMMDPWFHWSSGQGRPVLQVRNAAQNEGVCKYGVVSNVTCGNVMNDLYGLYVVSPLTGTTVYLNGLTRVTPLASSNGDSGGPLFGGNTAMGILVGVENSTNARLFTKISNAQGATGTRVCLEPSC